MINEILNNHYNYDIQVNNKYYKLLIVTAKKREHLNANNTVIAFQEVCLSDTNVPT